MQVRQDAPELRKYGHRRRAPVYPGARASLRGDLALEYQAPVLQLHPQVGEGWWRTLEDGGGEVEGSLDHGLGGPGTDDVRRGALAEQQREGVHQHRLARARFPGEDVETGREGERHVGDDGQVADAQLREHYRRSRSERSPQFSFLRMRAKKPSGPSRTSTTGRAARFTTSRSSPRMVVPTWPSNETRTSSLHGGISSTVTAASEGTTSGRTASVCGQIAAITMASTLGTTIGPPAERAYAVDPVGVAITMPSAEY